MSRIKVAPIKGQDGKPVSAFKLSWIVGQLRCIAGVDKAVLRSLCDHYPTVWIGVTCLAIESGWSERAAQKSLRRLESDEWIRPVTARVGGAGNSGQYTINDRKILDALVVQEQQKPDPKPPAPKPSALIAKGEPNAPFNSVPCTQKGDVGAQKGEPNACEPIISPSLVLSGNSIDTPRLIDSESPLVEAESVVESEDGSLNTHDRIGGRGGKDSPTKKAKRKRHDTPLAAFIIGLNAEPEGDGFVAVCPYHEDSHPSLALGCDANGKILVHCRSGCDQAEVWTAASALARAVPADACQEMKTKSAAHAPAIFKMTMDDVTRYNDNLVAVDGIYSWLHDCGINLAAAHRLQFGACANKGGFPRKNANGKDTNGFYACPALCVPHRDRAGQLIGLLWRDVENKNFTSAPGSRTDGLYAALHVDYTKDEVLVLEGSKDVAIAMSHGFNSVGIPSASYKLSDEDETILRQFKRVYLIPDNDEQGQGVRAMERIVERLLTVKERVTLVHLPVGVKDIGEFFKKNRLDFKLQLEGILGRK